VDAANGVGQLFGRRFLEQVTAHAGFERAPQIAGSREGGQDGHRGFGHVGANPLGQVQAGAARHFDVGQQQVGFLGLDHLPGFVAAGGAPDHLDVVLELEQ
jgi:hypothetical protein